MRVGSTLTTIMFGFPTLACYNQTGHDMHSLCVVALHEFGLFTFSFLPTVPIPSLSLFVDTDCIFAGATRFALSCTIELDENADDPIAAQIDWLPESIFSNSRITVESVSQLSDTTVYLSRLVFDPLLFADSLNYTCSGLFLPGNEASTGVSVSTYVDASDVADDTILLIVEGKKHVICSISVQYTSTSVFRLQSKAYKRFSWELKQVCG